MKRIIGLILSVVMLTALFTGCGNSQKNRVLFSEADLSKAVELGEYKGIAIDTSSEEYKKLYDSVIGSDVSNNNLYVKKTEGKVKEGDTANIDYEGKKDGVAFDGGTAQGYDLEIGSGSFIEGFEDGLIGVEVGKTVDLNLTFPKDYQSEELKGAKVVFTVKVNYITTDEPREPKDYYAELGYKSLKDYEEATKKTAIENYLIDSITNSSKFKEHPQKDMDLLFNSTKTIVEKNVQSSYGIDFATYLSYMGSTEEKFKEEQVKPMLESYMLLYAIADKENIKVEQKDITRKIDDAVKEIGNAEVTADTLKEYYGDYYFETMAYSEKVLDYMYENAKIS